MATLRRSLSALLTLAALLGAVALVYVLTRCGPPPAGGVAQAPEATPEGYAAPEGPATAPSEEGYPAPADDPAPTPEPEAPAPYPPPATMPPVSPEPTPIPWTTPTPWWNWPTPERPGGPTPTALPVRGPADSARGSIWSFVETDGDRALEGLHTGSEAAVERSDLLSLEIADWFWHPAGPRLPVQEKHLASPGGRYLTLFRGNFESDLIYIIDSHSGEARRLETMFDFALPSGETRYVQTFFGAWHPDERHIYLCDKEYGGVFLVDIYGEEPRQYISESLAHGGIAISPDGQQIAYAALPLAQSTYTLWVANADGSQARSVLESETWITPVAWSPDGEQLLFLHGVGLTLMDRDGTNIRPLEAHHTGQWGLPLPQWSPDGALILTTEELSSPTSEEESDPERVAVYAHASTFVVDVASGGKRPLVGEGRVGDVYATWSPDGRYVAYLSRESGAVEVWIVPREGGAPRQVTDTGQRHGPPVWVSTETED
jgi:WD40 repeat protein